MLRACCALLAVTAAAEQIPLPDGGAEFEWLSSGAFRVTRWWGPSTRTAATPAVSFESKQLKVEFQLPSLRAVVSTLDGQKIAELGGPVRSGQVVTLDRPLSPDERVYGRMGVSTKAPFFFSSAGYGQIVSGGNRYTVDKGQTSAQRLRVSIEGTSKLEYDFLYGPAPKEIFDQRRIADPVPEELPARAINVRTLTCESARALNAASLRGELVEYSAGPEWEAFLGAYVREVHDRGLPIFRPLALQFPRDARAAKQMNVIMFGDEMLVAPLCASPLTLPQGIWTDFRTNAEHKGRTSLTLTDPVTILVRNGSIVPRNVKGAIELHYFPKLGAEFFLLEPDLADYSQVHASPAGDFWRLEIESKVTRTFEWVLHHFDSGIKRIRVDAKSGADSILNLPLSALN